jgi:glutamate synthase (NADPH/NADH) small chain
LNETQKTIRSKIKVKSNLLPVEERINNFQEVNLGYFNLDEVIEECKRCYQCFSKSDPNERPPPCMKFCPTHCNSRDIIKNVLEGNINKALNIIYEHYPFPRCVERVCPGYCQLHCTAGKKGDPIQIPIIKRYLVDYYGPNDEFFKSETSKRNKVAIIGSGPLGLTTAYFLKKAGIEVTIFEKLNIIGGMLYLEIPEFRLPRAILNEEIENLKKLGIEIITNNGIDQNHHIEELFQSGYDMVVIGIGTHKPNWMELPGEDSQIILQAIELLKDFHLHKKIPHFDGKKVLVVGGGSTATDSARVAKRLGADVSILYRREKEQMPAGKTEIADSEDEGIIIKYLTSPVEFVCIEEEFQGAVCKKMELGEPDPEGKPMVIPLEDSEFREEADFIIEAIGQWPDLTGFDTNKIKVSEKNTIIVNEKFYTSASNVLAGGDCVSGSKSVVEAVAHGKIIADQIISYLSGQK